MSNANSNLESEIHSCSAYRTVVTLAGSINLSLIACSSHIRQPKYLWSLHRFFFYFESTGHKSGPAERFLMWLLAVVLRPHRGECHLSSIRGARPLSSLRFWSALFGPQMCQWVDWKVPALITALILNRDRQLRQPSDPPLADRAR